LRLDVVPAGQVGPVRFELNGKSLTIDPQSAIPNARALPVESFLLLTRYFSGDLLKEWKAEAAHIKRDGNVIQYRWRNEEVWLDAQRGVLLRYRRPGVEANTTDEIEIQSYVFSDGRWLPAAMRLRNRDTGWDAQLHFSKWTPHDTSDGLRQN
jgi:hypothetical protein